MMDIKSIKTVKISNTVINADDGYDQTSLVCADGNEYSCTYIGAGSTCIAFKIEAKGERPQILKVFYPLKFGTKKPILTLNNESRLELIDKNDKNEHDRRLNAFIESAVISDTVFKEYEKSRGDSIQYTSYISSLGVVQLSAYTGGKVLSEYLTDMQDKSKDRLIKMLSVLTHIMNDISIFHNLGLINLDLKPDNLWACSFDGEQAPISAIRNLDFSSAKRVNTLINAIGEAKEPTDKELLQLKSDSFVTSAPYYTPSELDAAFSLCRNNDIGDDIKKSFLFSLDLVAALKIFMHGLCPNINSAELLLLSDNYERLLRNFFENNSINGNIWEDFHIFARLRDLFRAVFSRNTTAKAILEKIALLKAVLCENATALPEKYALQFNKNLISATSERFSNKKYRFLSDEQGQSLTCLINLAQEYGITHPELLHAHLLKHSLSPHLAADIDDWKFKDSRFPIESFADSCLKQSGSRYWLTGEGGQGKSTVLDVLEAYLLEKRRPYIKLSLGSPCFPDDYSRLDKTLLSGSVVLLDAYDEASEYTRGYLVNFVIPDLNHFGASTLITSRTPIANDFKSYKQLYIKKLRPEQIKSALKGRIAEQMTSSLLDNTLMLKLYLQIGNSNIRLENESDIIMTYIESIYQSKADSRNVQRRDFVSEMSQIGKYIAYHDTIRGGSSCIPNELNELFKYEEAYSNETEYYIYRSIDGGIKTTKILKHIKTFHKTVEDVAVALYFLNRIINELPMQRNTQSKLELLTDIINRALRVIEYSSSDENGKFNILVFIGQLLKYYCTNKLITEDETKAIISYLRELNGKPISRVKLIPLFCGYITGNFILLGYNSNIFDDDFFDLTVNKLTVEKDSGIAYFFRSKHVKEIRVSKQGTDLLCIGPYVTSIYIGKNVTGALELEIPYTNPFDEIYVPRLKKVFIEEGNGRYIFDEHFLIDTETDTLVIACATENKTIKLPENIKTIGKYAFSGNKSIKKITLSSNLTTINDSAFSICASLKSINIPKRVTSIGDEAFCCCESLESITRPDSVTSIGDFAFDDCTSLESITIGNRVKNIDRSIFWGCTSLKKISVSNENPFFKSENGILYTKDGTTLIQYPPTKKEPSFIVPNGVTSIGDLAFSDCTSLKDITIPDSVTRISYSSFSSCKSLECITILGRVESIEDCTFSDCTSLKSIIIPKSVTSIGNEAFSGCYSLESVTIENGVNSIGEQAFENCKSLKSVIIPNSVTSIGKSAFHFCKSLKSINIPNSVKNIDKGTFLRCESLKTVIIENPDIEVFNGAFSKCPLIEAVIWNGERINRSDERISHWFESPL